MRSPPFTYSITKNSRSCEQRKTVTMCNDPNQNFCHIQMSNYFTATSTARYSHGTRQTVAENFTNRLRKHVFQKPCVCLFVPSFLDLFNEWGGCDKCLGLLKGIRAINLSQKCQSPKLWTSNTQNKKITHYTAICSKTSCVSVWIRLTCTKITCTAVYKYLCFK
jgi:hypothetical protein